MFWSALFDPFSILVLAAVVAMIVVSLAWLQVAARQRDVLSGGLVMLRKIGTQLAADHPIRRRLSRPRSSTCPLRKSRG